MEKQNWTQARLDLHEAQSLEPANRKVWLAGCRLYTKIGEWEEAIKCADKALKLNSNDAEALGFKGWAASEMTDWDKALTDFDKAISLTEESAELYVGRAHVYQNQEKFEEALSDCHKAEKLNSNIVAIYQISSNAYLRLGDKEKALQAASKAIELSPTALNYDIRGGIYNVIGREDLALKDHHSAGLIKQEQ